MTRNWCDHMRCWDGGASFFTCKAGIYHLQDELSHVFSTENGEMASIDFFSYASPFVNYLNGDYCSVGKEYKKCDCGRWYRAFEFHNRRPQQYMNTNGGFFDTEEVAKTLLSKFSIGFFSFHDGSVSIEDSMLDDEVKKNIVIEMAKIYVIVRFFTSPSLSNPNLRMLTTPTVGGSCVFDGIAHQTGCCDGVLVDGNVVYPCCSGHGGGGCVGLDYYFCVKAGTWTFHSGGGFSCGFIPF